MKRGSPLSLAAAFRVERFCHIRAASRSKAEPYLDLLIRVVEALKRNAPDDLHLSSRYAALIETCVLRFQEDLAPNRRQPSTSNRPTTPEMKPTDFLDMLPEAGDLDGDWFSLDPSLGSLPVDDDQGLRETVDNSLQYLFD